MKTALIAFIVSVVTAVLLGKTVIPLLKKLKLGQNILSYVKEHDYKSGTPIVPLKANSCKKASQSSRRRSGANPLKSVFCGGVYVAKSTLRGPRPKGTGLGRPDG